MFAGSGGLGGGLCPNEDAGANIVATTISEARFIIGYVLMER